MTTKADYHQHYPISSHAPTTSNSGGAGGGGGEVNEQVGVGSEGGQQLAAFSPFEHHPLHPLSPTTTSSAAGMVTLNPLFSPAHGAHAVGVSFNGVASFAPLAPPPPPPPPPGVPMQMATAPLPFPAAEHPLPPPPSSSAGSESAFASPPPHHPPPPPYSTVVPSSTVQHYPFASLPTSSSGGSGTDLSASPAPQSFAPFVVVAGPLPYPHPQAGTPLSPYTGSSPFFPGASPVVGAGGGGYTPFAAFGGPPPPPPPPAAPGQGWLGHQPHSAAAAMEMQAYAHQQQQHQQQPQMLTPWPPVPLRNIDEFLSYGPGGGVTRGGSEQGGGGYMFPQPLSAAQYQHHQQASGMVAPAATSSAPPQQSMPLYQPPQPFPPSSSSAAASPYPISSSSPYPISSSSTASGVGGGRVPYGSSSLVAPAKTASTTTTSSSMSSTPVPPHYQHQQQGGYSFPPYPQQQQQQQVPVPTQAAVVPPPPPPPAAAATTTTSASAIPPSAGFAPTHVPPTRSVAGEDPSSGSGGVSVEGGGKCAVDTCGAVVSCELSPCGCRLCRDHLGWVLRGGIEYPLPSIETSSTAPDSSTSTSTSSSGGDKPKPRSQPQKTQKLFRCVACGKKSTMQIPASPTTSTSTLSPTSSSAATLSSPPQPAAVPLSPLSVADADALAFSIKYFSAGPAPALSSSASPPPAAASPAPAPSLPNPAATVAYPFGYPIPLSPLSTATGAEEATFETAGGQHGRQDSFHSAVSSLSSDFSGYHPFQHQVVGMPTYDCGGVGAEQDHATAAAMAAGLVPGMSGLGLGLQMGMGGEGGGAEVAYGGLLPAFQVEEATARSGGRKEGGEEEQVYPISSARTLAAEQAQQAHAAATAAAQAEGKSVPPHLQGAMAFSASAGGGGSRPSTAVAVAQESSEGRRSGGGRGGGSGLGLGLGVSMERGKGGKGRSRSETRLATGSGHGGNGVASSTHYLTPPPPHPPRTPSPSSFQHASLPPPSASSASSISTPSASATSSPYTPYQPHPVSAYVPPHQQPPLFHVPGTAVNVTPAIVARAREQQQQQQLAQGGVEPVLRAAKPYGSPSYPRNPRPSHRSGPYTASTAPATGPEPVVASGANAYSFASANPFAASLVATSSHAVGGLGEAASTYRAYGPGGLPRRPVGFGYEGTSPTRGRRGGGGVGSPYGSPVSKRRDSLASSFGAGGGGGGMGSVTSSPVSSRGGYLPGSPSSTRGGGGRGETPREPPSFLTGNNGGGAGGGEGGGGGEGRTAPGGSGTGQEWRGVWPIVKVENIPFNTTMQDVLNWLPPGYLASKEYVPMPIHLVLHRATGRTLPHCYLELASVEQATTLIAMMDRTTHGERTVRVKWERVGELMRDFFSQEVFFQQPDTTRSPAAAPLPHLPPEGYKLPEVLLTPEDLQRLVTFCQKPLYFRERPFERAFYNMISLIAKFPFHCADWDEKLRDAMFTAATDVANKAMSFNRESPLFQDVIEKLVGVVLGSSGFTDAQKDDFHRFAPHVRPPTKVTPAKIASINEAAFTPPPVPLFVPPPFAAVPATLSAPPRTPPSGLNRSLGQTESSKTTPAPLQPQDPAANDPFLAAEKAGLPPSPPYYRTFPRGGIGRGAGAARRNSSTGDWVEVVPPATSTANASALGLTLDEVGPTPAEAAKVVTTRRGSAQTVKSRKSASPPLPNTSTADPPFQLAPQPVSVPSRSASASRAPSGSPPATPPASPIATKDAGKEDKVPEMGRRKSLRGWASQD